MLLIRLKNFLLSIIEKLICIFHWNYEFEKFPQPYHRVLSYKLVDLGVHAIIGHHPHIIQGVEIYKNKPIFYSLGNFYLPNYQYGNNYIKYNPSANYGLCVEITNKIENTMLYWTKIEDNKRLILVKKKNLSKSSGIRDLSSFSEFKNEEYDKWFKENSEIDTFANF